LIKNKDTNLVDFDQSSLDGRNGLSNNRSDRGEDSGDISNDTTNDTKGTAFNGVHEVEQGKLDFFNELHDFLDGVSDSIQDFV
jgi:hypothetical protein